jgi:hypothetical protein
MVGHAGSAPRRSDDLRPSISYDVAEHLSGSRAREREQRRSHRIFSSSSFGSLVQGTIGSRSTASIVRGQAISVRAFRPNCLLEIAVFGSTFCGLERASNDCDPWKRGRLDCKLIALPLYNAQICCRESGMLANAAQPDHGFLEIQPRVLSAACCLITSSGDEQAE